MRILATTLIGAMLASSLPGCASQRQEGIGFVVAGLGISAGAIGWEHVVNENEGDNGPDGGQGVENFAIAALVVIAGLTFAGVGTYLAATAQDPAPLVLQPVPPPPAGTAGMTTILRW